MADKKSLNVLLIEDNEGDAFLLKFYLGEDDSYSFNFDHAETLSAAFSSLSAKKYDIILMDLGLPDSYGVESIKALLDKFPNNLVIVLTGLMDEKVGLESVRYGAQDFLVKGRFDSKILVSSIVFAFERYSLNTKVNTLNTQILHSYERFNNLQELTNTGYFDIDIDNIDDYYYAEYVAKVIGYTGPMPISREVVFPFVDDLETLRTTLNKARIERRDGSFKTKMTIFKNPVEIRWKIRGQRMICALIYPEE